MTPPGSETAALRPPEPPSRTITITDGESVAVRLPAGNVIFGTITRDPRGHYRVTTHNKLTPREIFFGDANIAFIAGRDIFVDRYWII